MSLGLNQSPVPPTPPENKPNRRPSLSEFAEQFETAIREKQEMASRLERALGEVSDLTQLYQQIHKELETERDRMKSEIARLRDQLGEQTRRADKPPQTDSAAAQALLAAQEKLMRSEFDRKFQELTLEVRQQRAVYTQQMEKMKKQLSNCICRATR